MNAAERDDLTGFISDLFKSLNGYRPRFLDRYSDDELEAYSASLIRENDRYWEDHAEAKAKHKAEIEAAQEDPHGIVFRNSEWDEWPFEDAIMGYFEYYGYINPEPVHVNVFAALRAA